WHVKSDGVYDKARNFDLSNFFIVVGVCLHDPLSFVEAVRPDLFKYKKGVVRMGTQGICVGHRLMDQALKRSYYINCNLHRKRKNHRWNMRNEQYMGEIFTNICGVDNKCRQSFGIYQSFGAFSGRRRLCYSRRRPKTPSKLIGGPVAADLGAIQSSLLSSQLERPQTSHRSNPCSSKSKQYRDKGFCLDSTTMTLSVCVQEKSRHFTARTCNCIIIVLDAIKPITHKRLIKANNLHALNPN
ncbi:LOW QUALITY PROTEIN: hypothetical protein HID58_049449, partial [Brassica napus]